MLFAFVAIALALVGYWYHKWHHYTKDLGGIKGPRAWPIIGSGLEFAGGDSSVFLSKPYEFIQKYGDVVQFIVGFEQTILIRDYKLIEFFLSSNKHLAKSRPYTYVHRWLGTGLLTSDGEKWRSRRKVITPAFHFKILEEFAEVFDSNANVLIGKLAKEVGKGSTNVYPYITLCALDNICETAMGTSANAQEHTTSDYVISVKEMCRILTERSFSIFQQYHFFYQFTENYAKEKKALKILHDYTNSVIRARRQALLDVNEREVCDDVGQKKRVAFLDLLLKSTIDGKPLSDEDVREEVDTFMFEGHDTTASGMTFALHCIANDRRVQEKIIAEQRQLFADQPDKVPTLRDIQDMKYLDLVIKETLRLYPSVPFIGRELKEDCKYSDDITFKKGTQITMFPYALLRDAKFFPDPDEFQPERFENPHAKFPYAYVPFSAGPRNCIGQKFAMLEMKSVISKVIRKYELNPVVPAHKPILVPEAVLKSSNGILVSIKKRHW